MPPASLGAPGARPALPETPTTEGLLTLDSPLAASELSAAAHPYLDTIVTAARQRGAVPVTVLTDCVVNIAPDLCAKRDIVQNAIELAQALSIALPKVAILSAVEITIPAIPGTINAAALYKMADRGQITGAMLDGPLAFDNAISAASARNEGIASAVAGCPDILLVPSLEAGNMLYKQEKATRTVLEQAEVLSEMWAAA